MIKLDADNGLFKTEIQVLERAIMQIEDESNADNSLLQNYSDLVKHYTKLLKLAKKTFKISDVQGKELKKRTVEMKAILDNSNQGFLTFSEDLKVNREYSIECMSIFNKKIAGCRIDKLLANSNNELEKTFEGAFREVFDAFSDDERDLALISLPGVIQIGESFIDIKYRVINQNEEGIHNISVMIVMTNITEKRKTEDQVIYLSYHDKLTSLNNRLYVESVVSQLQVHSNMPLSVIMADMNGLKLTNDVFGHEVGDELLKKTARIFLSCFRKSDIIARWGGDEFIIVLPNTTQETCKALCERIYAMCNEVEADPIKVSVSLGCATMESHTMEILELLKVAENRMYSNKVSESKSVRKNILTGIEKLLHTKCFEDCNHIERLQRIAANFVKVLKLDANSMEMITLPKLVSLHDVGKIAIPKEILSKQSRLTENEWEIIKNYTEIGFRIAQSIDEPFLSESLLALRERWDGTGYPYGLRGTGIPYLSRIMSIIETYDIMIHDRPYKEAIDKAEAIKEIERLGGSQFDPSMVRVFIDNLNEIVGNVE